MTDAAKSAGRNFTLALGFLIALAVFFNSSYHVTWLLREADLWWHIRSGQVMLSTHQMHFTDTFSYTHEGQPWIAKEWLSQVIYALSYNLAGWAGPLLVAAVTISLTAFLFYTYASQNLQPFFAGVLTLVCTFLIQGVAVARPHILTFPIALALTYLLFSASRRQSVPPYWTLALTLVWSNLHGSFPLAFIIGGCAFLDYLERSRVADRPKAIRWMIYLGLSVLVTLINPYFIKPYQIAFSLAGGLAVMKEISEWAPFTVPDDRIVEVALMLFLLVLLKVRARFSFGQIAFVLLTLNMMFTHIRFLYVFFLLVPLALLPDIVEAKPVVSRQEWAKRKRDGFEQLIGRSPQMVGAFVIVVGVLFSGFLMRKDGVLPPEDISISGALAHVRESRDAEPAFKMNVFNDYNFGGPLILEGIKTYVDGRAEQLFFGEFMEKYLASGKPKGDEELLNIISDPRIGWTIFPPEDRRNLALAKQAGWIKAYEDKFAVIFKRRL